LVEQYHPGALLFVTEMRDYAAANVVEVAEQFLADECDRPPGRRKISAPGLRKIRLSCNTFFPSATGAGLIFWIPFYSAFAGLGM
jgi:hypothetical protein